MNSFVVCLNAILPIFLIIALGFLARHAGIIREGEVPRMNAVAFKVFMPVMCFYNIYTSDLSTAIRPKLLVYAVAAVLLEYFLSWLYARLFVKDPRRRGVMIQGLYRSNYLIIGLPVAASLLGGSELGTVSVLAAVVVPIFNVLAVISLEIYNGEKPDAGRLVLDILKNPLILGIAAGILALLIRLRLPTPLETAVRDVSRVASPLMLFLLGAFFRFGSVRSHLKDLVVVVLGRLVVFPAIFVTAAALLGFRGIEFVALLTVFSSSTAVASFTMAQQMGGDAELAGDIVIWTSMLCSLTLFCWSFLFKSLGMF